MIKISICLAAISLTLSALLAQSPPPVAIPAPSAPPPTRDHRTTGDHPAVVIRQWRVNNSDKVNVNEPYELLNMRREELNLSSQAGPFDLGFAFIGRKSGQIVFRRPNERDHGPVMYLETVALYSTKFRRYKTANSWSRVPVYEWQIREQQGASFALYNTKRNDYLVLATDGKGANETLTWLSKK